MNFKTYGLDIGYITNSLAVCSGPSDKITTGVASNNIYKLVQTLNENHGKHNWKIINLRREKIGYDPEVIVNNGGYFDLYEVADHQPIPFRLVLEIVKNIDNFIEVHKTGAVVIHCKYGKGRSGQLACSYVMFKHGSSVSEANELFKQRRKLYKSGVTIKSQLRYLDYFEIFLQNDQAKKLYKHFSKACELTVSLFKLVIHKPSPELMTLNRYLDRNVFMVKIKVQEPEDGWSSSFDATLSSTKTDFIEIECDKELSGVIIEDLKFTVFSSFNTVNGKFWMNVPMEIIKDMIEKDQLRTNFLQKKFKQYTVRRIVRWNEFDGYHGTMKKGLKLFDNIEIHMSVVFKNFVI